VLGGRLRCAGNRTGVLVFGLGPFPRMGIAGAVAGIVIGYSVAAVVLLVYLTSQSTDLRLRLLGTQVKLAPIAAILKVGAFASIDSLCSIAAVTVITAYIARLRVDALAGYWHWLAPGVPAHSDGLRVSELPLPPWSGCTLARSQIERAHKAGWTAAFYSAGLCGLVGGLIAVFPSLWANPFTDSETIRASLPHLLSDRRTVLHLLRLCALSVLCIAGGRTGGMASDRQRGTRVRHRRRLRRPFSHARCRSRTFLLVDRRRYSSSSIDIRYSQLRSALGRGAPQRALR